MLISKFHCWLMMSCELAKLVQLYLYMYLLFLKFASHLGYYGVLSRVPWLYSRSFLFVCFKYSSAYRLIPNSQLVPPSSSPRLVATSSFSKSVRLLLFVNMLVHTIFVDSTYKDYQMIVVFLCLTYSAFAPLLSCVRCAETPWTLDHHSPLSMEFSRKE